MPDLWKRDWSVTIGTTRISPDRRSGRGISVQFEAEKSLTREPNTATISVFNLSEAKRSEVERGAQVELRAGYVSTGTSMIFSGEARRVYSMRQDLDVVLRIEGRDAGLQYRSTALNRSWGPDTPLSVVLRAAVDAMGIDAGNLDQFEQGLELATGGSIFEDGYTATGRADRVLNTLVTSMGLRWSVQNGALQLREPGQPAERRAIVLGPTSGLIGSPTREFSGRGRADRQSVNAVSLLRPGIYPGRVVELRSAEIRGNYRVKKARYTGDSGGDAWDATLDLEDY